jgi:mevalonate kinase
MPLVTVDASAPAKVILVGEHAVVYGEPAIAVPVSSVRAFARVQPNQSSEAGFRIVAADEGVILTLNSHPYHALVVTARLVFTALKVSPPDVTITIRSQIPVASGMGSGAAVATALARAIFAVLDHPLGDETLNPIIFEVEKIHHGTPSGIDNSVVVYEKPVYFVRGQPLETLTIGMPLLLLIGDTGLASSTRLAVGDVRQRYEAEPMRVQSLMDEIGALVTSARRAIEMGDVGQLGGLMWQNHQLLRRLTVSCAELDNLVTAAMNAGALGGKLSGGGRGGNMIALVTPGTQASVKQALLQAGAVNVFATTVG